MDDPPTHPKYQEPLVLTDEQVEFIRPLLKREREGSQPKMILAQVRQAPYPKHGQVQIAFCLVDYGTAGKILNLIESSKNTRYAPVGSRANFVEILPQGEVVFVAKKHKKPKVETPKPIKPPTFSR